MVIERERFGIAFKYLYIQGKLSGNNSQFFVDAYKAHLEVLNGFKEEHKTCFEDYITGFDYLIQDVQKYGIRGPIAKNGDKIVNGSHRAALAMYLNIPLPSVQTAYSPFIFDYKFFDAVPVKYKDAAAITIPERLNPNTRLAVVFPGALNAHNILSDYDIYYHKKVWIEKPINLIKALYHGESWADHEGSTNKANECFKNGRDWISVYLVDFKGSELIAKETVRNYSGIGNHSIHITDTQPETLDLSRVLFNENSLHFINNSEYKGFDNFERLFSEFNKPDSAISGSAILSAYGFRDCRDLDYICTGDDPESHNEHTKELYPVSRFEIINNPENHFWHRGKKFVSLEMSKIMKQKRNEAKDIEDLKNL